MLVEVHIVPTELGDELAEYGPTAAADRRMGVLTHVDLVQLAQATVKAVAKDRRHLRRPRRASLIATISAAPRRSTEWIIAGVPPREE